MKASMNSLIFWLQKRPEFRFLGSLKLAIPLLLIVAAVVAWGTIVESKYNAEMARIVVYQADWFSALMSLLWINIFCATVLRYPFRAHHTGFVITHIGLLTLLAGGVVTSTYGIDGSMAVTEGLSESMVSLPKLVFGIAPDNSTNFQTVEIQRRLQPTDDFSAQNQLLGHIARIETYLPFAEINSTYRSQEGSDDVAVSFILKSPFFNVSEFLHSSLTPAKQMGPAMFELKRGQPNQSLKPTKAAKVDSPKTKSATIQIVDPKTEKILHEISLEKLSQLRRFRFDDMEIELKKAFRAASVADGGLAENEGGKLNPALEISIKKGEKSYREVIFARFPGFSLNKNPPWSIRFKYLNDQLDSDQSEPTIPAQMGSIGSGHYVRFYVDSEKGNEALIELEKNKEVVLRKSMKPGETIQTPWMGMEVTLASLVLGAAPVSEVTPIEPRQREEMPGGALKILVNGQAEPLWLAEGEVKEVPVKGRSYSFYFGRKMIRLPFKLNLLKFYKKDYPGTETPMSFESDVTINKSSQVIKISMNEPLERDGYTLYQSSYQLNRNGGPAISIFSVNYDPGRLMKYIGSLILCLGIVIFVIQRSSFYKNLQKRKA